MRKHPKCAIHHFSQEQTISVVEAIWIKNFAPESVCPSCMIQLERKIYNEEIGRELQKQAQAKKGGRNVFSDRVSRLRMEIKSKQQPPKR